MRKISKITLLIILALLAFSPFARAQGNFQSLLFTSYVKKAAVLIQKNFIYKVSEAQLIDGAQKGLVQHFALPSQSLQNWEEFEGYLLNLNTRFPEKSSLISESALQGMVKSLQDPYSAFMVKKERQSWESLSRGEGIGGIGVELAPGRGCLVIVGTLTRSPAAYAKLQTGDKILAIDGKNLLDLDFYDAGNLLEGSLGAILTLRLERQGQAFNCTLKRALIKLPALEAKHYKVGKGLLGYLKFSYFGAETYQQFLNLMQKLEYRKPKALIIDLRGNPGGDFEAALKIASTFVCNAPLVYVQKRSGSAQPVICRQNPLYAYPLVVLIDQGTASAAEVLACALRDNGKALLFGEKSFGKALVQTIFSLAGDTALRLTTAKYLTPKGKDINKIGLSPDVAAPSSQVLHKALQYLGGNRP
jgi:carboxyl-terminal processing protease